MQQEAAAATATAGAGGGGGEEEEEGAEAASHACRLWADIPCPATRRLLCDGRDCVARATEGKNDAYTFTYVQFSVSLVPSYAHTTPTLQGLYSCMY